MTRAERQMRARIAAHASWARTRDRTARTKNGRAGLEQRFLDEADGDPYGPITFERLTIWRALHLPKPGRRHPCSSCPVRRSGWGEAA